MPAPPIVPEPYLLPKLPLLSPYEGRLVDWKMLLAGPFIRDSDPGLAAVKFDDCSKKLLGSDYSNCACDSAADRSSPGREATWLIGIF